MIFSWIQVKVHEDHLEVGLQVVVEQPVCLLRLLDPLLEAPEHPHNHKYLEMTNLHRS